MPKEHLKLRLTLDVDYDLDADVEGANPDELRQNLRTIVEHALGNGMLTGDSGAAVAHWDYTVRDRCTNRNDVNSRAGILRWMETLPENDHFYIDDDGIRLRAVSDPEAYIEVGGHDPDEEEEE